MKMQLKKDNLLIPTRDSARRSNWGHYRLGKAAKQSWPTAPAEPREARYRADGSLRFPEVSMQARVISHLGSVALSTLNANRLVAPVARNPGTHQVPFIGRGSTITDLECAELLWAYVLENAGETMVTTFDTIHPLSDKIEVEQLWGMCQRAAAHARAKWDAGWTAEMKRRAALGGKTSKRGPSLTLEAVAALYDLLDGLPEHKHASTLAKHLDFDVKTVRRRLAELKDLLASYVKTEPEEVAETEDADPVVAAVMDDMMTKLDRYIIEIQAKKAAQAVDGIGQLFDEWKGDN